MGNINNNFNGKTNFYGPTQIVSGNVINNDNNSYDKCAHYMPEPKWRSPITMSVLNWISFVLGILSLFPLKKMVLSFLTILGGTQKLQNNSMDLTIFAILILLLIIVVSLREITKKQIRYPLFFNYAISGYGKKLTFEKIHIGKCPQCGGEMKYYNKAIEWTDKYSDGKIKREVTKRIPVFECKRNADHWYKVDPAEDKV